MKRVHITAAFLLLCATVSAEQETLINGENAIKETTRITFNGDNAVITYRDGSSFTYDIASVELNFTPPAGKLEDKEITKIKLEKSRFFSINQLVEDIVVVEGLDKGGKYIIYNTSGKQLTSGSAEEGTTKINVKGLPSGTYMFCTQNKNVKFIKK
ncbi:MAG: T9SS type A sorting domain-containing protein [Paludibacteraceae bacterium]|nr:T9SS type A sorting domain-containing protein [Paludibacteraceae bacterium]